MHSDDDLDSVLRGLVLDETPAPRSLDVFMSRNALAKITSQPPGKVFRAFASGLLLPDAVDTRGQPLFLMQRLPMLKLVLEKANSTTHL